MASRKRWKESLGAVEVKDIATVLDEIRSRHPGIRLREYDERGPRAVWDIWELSDVVRRDLAAMEPRERAAADVYRYFWGYDRDKVIVVHAPVRGAPIRQFEEL